MSEIEKQINKATGTICYRISSEREQQVNAVSSTDPGDTKYAILLLHGLASNMTRWSEFVATTELVKSVDVLRVDLRGHGKSMVYQRILMSQWCDDIKHILQAEKYTQFIIIGHSLGAQIAMHFAHRYPQYCKSLVLIDPVFPVALKGVLNVVRWIRYGLLFLIYCLLFIAKTGFNKKKFPYRDLFELDINTRKILNGNSQNNIAKLYMNPFADLRYIPFVNYCQDIFEVTGKLPNMNKVKCAVLCLLSKGATISYIDITKSQLARFEHHETQVIDADHWLLTEKPNEARVAIDNWCAKILTGC